MLPSDVSATVDAVAPQVGTRLGIHVHNDTGCAVANSLVAVEHGVFQVQGVVNGYGERTGNADLIPIAANLNIGAVLTGDEVNPLVKKYVAENKPMFKEIVESQLAFAKRATQWEHDYVINRSMAYDHYFGPNAKKPL